MLHVVESSIDFLNSISTSLHSIKYNTLYDLILKNEHNLRRTIQLAHVNKCIQINNYYLLNKICLSGFNFDDIDIYPELNLDIEKTLNSKQETFLVEHVTVPAIKSRTNTINLTKSNINLTPRLPSIKTNTNVNTSLEDKLLTKSVSQKSLRDRHISVETDDFELIQALAESNKLTDKRSKSYYVQTKTRLLSTSGANKMPKSLTCLDPKLHTANDKNQ